MDWKFRCTILDQIINHLMPVIEEVTNTICVDPDIHKRAIIAYTQVQLLIKDYEEYIKKQRIDNEV